MKKTLAEIAHDAWHSTCQLDVCPSWDYAVESGQAEKWEVVVEAIKKELVQDGLRVLSDLMKEKK